MTLKLMHVADLHLDHPFTGTGARNTGANERREGLRQALQRALDLAQTRHVDAVTIGGDLYDAAYASPDTALFLQNQFSRMAPIPVFIAPGDQDPYTSDSIYAYMDWPANVHIFKEPRLTPVDLCNEVQLWGMAYENASFTRSGLVNFEVPNQKPAVLLMHGTLADPLVPENRRSGITFAVQEVRNAGFQLALIGHEHNLFLAPEGKPLVYNPGSPEPINFEEEMGHSVLLAEWDEQQWTVEAIGVNRWKCRTWELDAGDYTTQTEMMDKIRYLVGSENDGRNILGRVILRGQPAAGVAFDPAEMSAMIALAYPYVSVEDQTVLSFDLDSLETELTIRGSFVRRIRAQMEASPQSNDPSMQALVHRALSHGLRALEGRKVTL
jgi:exonuclease SbcD